ncbi:hypothetical protein [Chelativorans xinjiangense]|uniref:hypothetical protein n=1 Tax=Chelativorans xinjiangense TaxID=2681485 RepID=UPI00135964A2|nr:hypothetical protein [Chelativorans xinjiangense]
MTTDKPMDVEALCKRLEATGGYGQSGPLKREAAIALRSLSADLEKAREFGGWMKKRERDITAGTTETIEALFAERDVLKARSDQLQTLILKADDERGLGPVLMEAVDKIAAAEAECVRLTARLEAAERVVAPLAEAADSYDPPEDGDDDWVAWAHDFTQGHLRAAREWMKEAKRHDD